MHQFYIKQFSQQVGKIEMMTFNYFNFPHDIPKHVVLKQVTQFAITLQCCPHFHWIHMLCLCCRFSWCVFMFGSLLGWRLRGKQMTAACIFFKNEPAYNQHFLDLYQATGFSSVVVVVEILRESGSFFHRDPGGHWWEISCQLTKPGRGMKTAQTL